MRSKGFIMTIVRSSA